MPIIVRVVPKPACEKCTLGCLRVGEAEMMAALRATVVGGPKLRVEYAACRYHATLFEIWAQWLMRDMHRETQQHPAAPDELPVRFGLVVCVTDTLVRRPRVPARWL